MKSRVSIYAQTRAGFAEALFSRFGKGRRYAELLYSQWMQTGSLEGLVIEPQGRKLFSEMKEKLEKHRLYGDGGAVRQL